MTEVTGIWAVKPETDPVGCECANPTCTLYGVEIGFHETNDTNCKKEWHLAVNVRSGMSEIPAVEISGYTRVFLVKSEDLTTESMILRNFVESAKYYYNNALSDTVLLRFPECGDEDTGSVPTFRVSSIHSMNEEDWKRGYVRLVTETLVDVRTLSDRFNEVGGCETGKKSERAVYAKIVQELRDGFSFGDSGEQYAAYELRDTTIRCREDDGGKYIDIWAPHQDAFRQVNPYSWNPGALPVRIMFLRASDLGDGSMSLDWLVQCVKNGVGMGGTDVRIRFGTGYWTRIVKVCPTIVNKTVTVVTMLTERDVRNGQAGPCIAGCAKEACHRPKTCCSESDARKRHAILMSTPVYTDADIASYSGKVDKGRLHEAYKRCRFRLYEILRGRKDMSLEDAFTEASSCVLHIVYAKDTETGKLFHAIEDFKDNVVVEV